MKQPSPRSQPWQVDEDNIILLAQDLVARHEWEMFRNVFEHAKPHHQSLLLPQIMKAPLAIQQTWLMPDDEQACQNLLAQKTINAHSQDPNAQSTPLHPLLIHVNHWVSFSPQHAWDILTTYTTNPAASQAALFLWVMRTYLYSANCSQLPKDWRHLTTHLTNTSILQALWDDLVQKDHRRHIHSWFSHSPPDPWLIKANPHTPKSWDNAMAHLVKAHQEEKERPTPNTQELCSLWMRMQGLWATASILLHTSRYVDRQARLVIKWNSVVQSNLPSPSHPQHDLLTHAQVMVDRQVLRRSTAKTSRHPAKPKSKM